MESVSMSNLDKLTRPGLRGGVDMRPTLLRVLTDLYVQKLTHTPDEERHYTELALRLLDVVDAATRAAVSARLARHLAPPWRVAQRLAVDLPEIAAPIRAHPVLHRRPQTAIDAAAPVTPARPPAAADFPKTDIVATETRGAISSTIVDPPGLISAGIAGELNELFLAASAAERRLILLNLEIAVPIAAGRVAFARDPAIAHRLESAALSRKREDFVRHLAQALRIPGEQARRIACDELGETIVIAAKALNVPREVLYRILLFVNTAIGHSVERVHALAALYDELTMHAAEHMVAIWQALPQHQRSQATYRPLLWNDEARARARTATAAVRRAPAAQRPGERRDAS